MFLVNSGSVSALELGWFSNVPTLILADCVSALELGLFSNVPSLILEDCVSALELGWFSNVPSLILVDVCECSVTGLVLQCSQLDSGRLCISALELG